MSKLDIIKAEILSVKLIPKVDSILRASLALKEEYMSLGLMTATLDDSLYAALDEATKKANIDVVYAKSFYAGSSYSSGPLSGEIIGIIAGNDPEEVENGINAVVRYIDEKAYWYSANDKDDIIFFPHVIPNTGRYLSKEANIKEGEALAYLIAPPIEALYSIDAVLKEANVNLKKLYPPPSETNFAGGLFSGDIESCEEAARVFQKRVIEVAESPKGRFQGKLSGNIFYNSLKTNTSNTDEFLKFIIEDTGERVAVKPDYYTHLKDFRLVPKTHHRIKLRGEIDNIQSDLIITQTIALNFGKKALTMELQDILVYLRRILYCEYTGSKLEEPSLFGLSSDQIREASHNPEKFFPDVKHAVPHYSQGITAVRLNSLRSRVREVEITAAQTFIKGGIVERADILKGLNRLSSIFYVMYCKDVAGIYDK